MKVAKRAPTPAPKTTPAVKAPEFERCAGCDQSARLDQGGHPIVGIMHEDEADALGFDTAKATAEGFVQVPVCAACHQDPQHRVHSLKCHFFQKQHGASAVRVAGRQSIGGPL